MSECLENQDGELSLMLAGELDTGRQATLEEHIAECQTCQQQLAFLKGFRSKLAQAEAHDYPGEVHSRLLAALSQEQSQKVVSLESKRTKSRVPQLVTRYLVAAALLCVCGLGVIRAQYGASAPEAVASLVDHHDTCWHIEPSPGRDEQFNEWVETLGGELPPTPAVSPELVAFDQRECPAGEVRAGHLLYHKGEQKVSVYILPADKFLASYGEALKEHSHKGREVILTQKGEWVYGVVAELPRAELKKLVDTDHLAMLRQYLAQRSSCGA